MVTHISESIEIKDENKSGSVHIKLKRHLLIGFSPINVIEDSSRFHKGLMLPKLSETFRKIRKVSESFG